MRICTPRGNVVKVVRMNVLAEEIDEFNGTRTYRGLVAKDMSVKPTGLEFLIDDSDCFSRRRIQIGNLPFEKVVEIQRSLLKDGYYDFSGMKYQRVTLYDVSKIKIDNGVSLPYFDEPECMNIFDSQSPLFGNHIDIEDEDDDYEDDTEGDE